MKYVKQYEDIEYTYKKGDYVLLNIDKIVEELKKGESPPGDNLAKIVHIYYDQEYDYDVRFFNYGKNESYEIKRNEILRLLTPEEIKEYKEKRNINKSANKYNL